MNKIFMNLNDFSLGFFSIIVNALMLFNIGLM